MQTLAVSLFKFHDAPLDSIAYATDLRVAYRIEARLLLGGTAEINRASLAQVGRDHATIRSDEAQKMIRTLKANALLAGSLFDMLTNTIFAGAVRLHARPARVVSKLVEQTEHFYFACVKMSVGLEHGARSLPRSRLPRPGLLALCFLCLVVSR